VDVRAARDEFEAPFLKPVGENVGIRDGLLGVVVELGREAVVDWRQIARHLRTDRVSVENHSGDGGETVVPEDTVAAGDGVGGFRTHSIRARNFSVSRSSSTYASTVRTPSTAPATARA
jgi:hypothetical protein